MTYSDRALQPTLFTGTLCAAIRGELTEYANYPTPLIDPSRTNEELGITLTPVRAASRRP